MSFENCLQKQKDLCDLFLNTSKEEVYAILLQLNNRLPPFDETMMTHEHLVRGCQSNLWLYTEFNTGKISFFAKSDALISSGVATLFVLSYSNESPETVLKCPPIFIEKINLNTLLSPGRTNGALSLHLKMKQLCIPHLLAPSPN